MAENAPKSTLRKRPLSPHLSVYKPQMSSVTSITHRATGVFLLIGAFVLVKLLWEIATHSTCQCMSGLLHTIIGKLALLAWSAALYYHLFNGIRHLSWDAGKGFEVKTSDRNGWVVIILTFAATALSWVLAMGGSL